MNGEVAPLLFVSPGQINAQVPFDVSTGQPVALTVTNGGTQSNAVALSVHPGAPGIFEYGKNQLSFRTRITPLTLLQPLRIRAMLWWRT